jgi:SAM-dependent methyltransferase
MLSIIKRQSQHASRTSSTSRTSHAKHPLQVQSGASRRMPPRLQARSINVQRMLLRADQAPGSSKTLAHWSPPRLRAARVPPASGAGAGEQLAALASIAQPCRADPASIQDRLGKCLLHPHGRKQLSIALHAMLMRAGLPNNTARGLARYLLKALAQDKPLPEIEAALLPLLDNLPQAGNGAGSVLDQLRMEVDNCGQRLTAHLQAHLAELRNQKVLDFGGGFGAIASVLPAQLDPTRLVSAGMPPMPAQEPALLPAGSFDGVLAVDMLHRFDNGAACLVEIERLLKPGGKLYMIETVLRGRFGWQLQRDYPGTFLLDYAQNRLLRKEKLPVAGAFGAPADWLDNLAHAGLKLRDWQLLGSDVQCGGNAHALFLAHKPAPGEEGGNGRKDMSALELYGLIGAPV